MTCSERLRNPKLQIPLVKTEPRRRSIKRNPAWPTLRNQKLRRLQQPAVINRQRAAKRRLHTKTQTDGVGPMRAQVRGVDRRDDVTRRYRRLIVLTKQIANAPENVATVVKRHDLQRPRHRHARFEVHNRKRIATDRHREWVKKHYVLL